MISKVYKFDLTRDDHKADLRFLSALLAIPAGHHVMIDVGYRQIPDMRVLDYLAQHVPTLQVTIVGYPDVVDTWERDIRDRM